MHRLAFTHTHSYANDKIGVALPIVLRFGSNRVPIVASIDTGASFCLFAAEMAARLGLDLPSGEPKRFRTATGIFEAYGHEIEITAAGLATYSMVYFYADPLIVIDVLGGWAGWIAFGSGWSITTAGCIWPLTTAINPPSAPEPPPAPSPAPHR